MCSCRFSANYAFSDAELAWQCPACSYDNELGINVCAMCQTFRPPALNADAELAWKCPACSYDNELGINVCAMCQTFRPPALNADAELAWKCPACSYDNELGINVCAMCQTFRPPALNAGGGRDEDGDAPPECRMILLGKTGSGKSSTGNTVLGRAAFPAEASPASVTRACVMEKATRHGKEVHVVDTPGIFDIGTANEDITREITTWVRMSVPGPHAFILVTRIGRFTPEEKNTFDTFEQIFGEEMYKYAIVLFTGKDEIDKEGKTLDEYLERSPPELEEILRKCQRRCIAFNNNGGREAWDEMCGNLLRIVDELVAANHGSCYTNTLYQRAEHAMTERTRQTMDECATDRSLPAEFKLAKQFQYEDDIQLLSAQLESLAMRERPAGAAAGAREMDAMKIGLLEMQVKQKSLELELTKATMGSDLLQQRVDNQQMLEHRLRRQDIDEKKKGSSWLEGVKGVAEALQPLVLPVVQSILIASAKSRIMYI